MTPGASGAAEVASSLGARIRRARRARGWTQAALAAQVGVAAATVSRWEREQTAPEARVRAILAAALGTQPADLLETTRRSIRRTRDLDVVADRIARALDELAGSGGAPALIGVEVLR